MATPVGPVEGDASVFSSTGPGHGGMPEPTFDRDWNLEDEEWKRPRTMRIAVGIMAVVGVISLIGSLAIQFLGN